MDKDEPKPETHKTKKPVQRKEVYVLRDFKEYVGESSLIVFSVLLALFLTEMINTWHEKEQTRALMANIKAELVKNKKAEEKEYAYEQTVLKSIDSAINNQAFLQKIISNGEFHGQYIIPHGVLYSDQLSRVAWQVAQNHNISLKINFKLVEQLTDIYDQQARIEKLEDGVAKVLLTYESRNAANGRITLILLRDTYKGWAFARAKDLIKKYELAIKAVGDE